MANHAISVTVEDRPGMLFKTTQILTENAADIRYVDILHRKAQTEIFFECELPNAIDPVIARLRTVETLGPAPSQPVVVRAGLDAGQKAEVSRRLLNIRGRRLEEFFVAGLAPAPDYSPIAQELSTLLPPASTTYQAPP